ncbi:MAG: hypothetical protein DMG42_13425, partial [Acidobacteria bacterium]
MAHGRANHSVSDAGVAAGGVNDGFAALQCAAREPRLSHVEFYAKAEWFNPGGSVKDRPALNIIQAGLASGALKRGKAIIDATSGNTGIAYAMIGAAMGYPV